jgi:hypothetical protein
LSITGADVSPAEQGLRYELAVLSCQLLDQDRTVGGVLPWVSDSAAAGRLLGCWTAENGRLGRVYVLRGFADDAELAAERQRTRLHSAPFGAGAHLTDLSLQSFAPFPFMPPVRTGQFGPVYEIRDYHLVPGGLPPSIAGWRQALPARHRVNPIVVVMYALDGPARIVQIWPFHGLDERVTIRRNLYSEGVWPPPGAPDQIIDADSIIAWPTDFSPLR